MSKMITIKKSEYDKLKKYEEEDNEFIKRLNKSLKDIEEGNIISA